MRFKSVSFERTILTILTIIFQGRLVRACPHHTSGPYKGRDRRENEQENPEKNPSRIKTATCDESGINIVEKILLYQMAFTTVIFYTANSFFSIQSFLLCSE